MFSFSRMRSLLSAALVLAAVAIMVVTFGGWRGRADDPPARPAHPAILSVPVGADLYRAEVEAPEAIRALSATIEADGDLHDLVRFQNLERLDLTLEAGGDLKGIAVFQNLSVVVIHASRPGVLDLSDLATLPHLRSVTLRNVRVDTLEVFSRMTGLRSLTVLNGAVRDLSGLAASAPLESLILDNFPRPDGIPRNGDVFLGPALVAYDPVATPALDLSRLGGRPNLRVLVLVGARVSGLEALARMPDLHALWLLRAGLTDLSEIGTLRYLRTLKLAYNLEVRDVSPLGGLLDLEDLNLRGTAVADLGRIPALPDLVQLDLRDTPLSGDALQEFLGGIEVRQ
jgi:hypothetical protein